MPGFEDNLIGRNAGDHVEFDLRFPDDYGNKQMAGKTTRFAVDIKEVRERAEVPVDDQFAKDLGVDDLEALRKAIREQMDKEYSQVSRMRLKRALLDALAASHDFEVPPGMVAAEFDAIWHTYQAEQAHAHDHDHGHHHDHDHDHDHGHDHDHDGKHEEGKPEDDPEARAEAQQVAERRVRLGLLLGEVGRRNNVTITPEELSKAVFAEASRYPGREKEVIEYIKRTPQALASLRAPIFEDKVVDFILERAQISERHVTPEELMKEPDAPTSTESTPIKEKAKKKSAAKKD